MGRGGARHNPECSRFTGSHLLSQVQLAAEVRGCLWKSDVIRPNWAGFMQNIHKKVCKEKSSILFPPMIDLDTSDVNCVNSTLHYVSQHAQEHGIPRIIIIFDQPLWYKAFYTEGANSPLRKGYFSPWCFSRYDEFSWKQWIPHERLRAEGSSQPYLRHVKVKRLQEQYLVTLLLTPLLTVYYTQMHLPF